MPSRGVLSASLVLVAITLLPAVLALTPPTAATAEAASSVATATATGEEIDGRFDVGGRSLYLRCTGTGSPTVVLEAGYRDRADVWTDDLTRPGSGRQMVQSRVAAFSRVCSYDRPGTATAEPLAFSRSDPAPMPRTARDVVADLHALLRAADVPGPYVLVGHSYGGLFVRLFASAYPDEVVGLVLVDPAHEEQGAQLQARMTAEEWAAFRRMLADETAQYRAIYPDVEEIDVEASAAQVRAARAAAPLRPMPLVVLTHGVPPVAGDAEDLFADLAGLVPGGRRVTAELSGHHVQQDQPELVVKVIRQVVAAAGDPSTWGTPAAGPLGP